MKRFALVGAAGCTVPRYIADIRDSGIQLGAALGPNRCVGTFDSYFPYINFVVSFCGLVIASDVPPSSTSTVGIKSI